MQKWFSRRREVKLPNGDLPPATVALPNSSTLTSIPFLYGLKRLYQPDYAVVEQVIHLVRALGYNTNGN
jgi:hypothetical protein